MISYNKASRPDDLPRSWRFSVQNDFENNDYLITLADDLFEIPVHPLPDPLVSGNEAWHSSMNISAYKFVDTWHEYLNTLRCHGTILRSEFEYIPLPGGEQPAPPRPQCAATTEVKLDRKVQGSQLYFVASIFATGRVRCLAMDPSHYNEIFD